MLGTIISSARRFHSLGGGSYGVFEAGFARQTSLGKTMYLAACPILRSAKVMQISAVKTDPAAVYGKIFAHFGVRLLFPPSMMVIQDVTRVPERRKLAID